MNRALNKNLKFKFFATIKNLLSKEAKSLMIDNQDFNSKKKEKTQSKINRNEPFIKNKKTAINYMWPPFEKFHVK